METTKSGIYRLYWPSTKYYYIGQSGDIYTRYINHLRALQTGTHPNNKVVEVFKKFGLPSFEILQECDEYHLRQAEKEHLKGTVKDIYACNIATYTKGKPKEPKNVTVSAVIRSDHAKMIRIKYKSIEAFIDEYISIVFPDSY